MTKPEREYQPKPEAIAKPFVHDTPSADAANSSPPERDESINQTDNRIPLRLTKTCRNDRPLLLSCTPMRNTSSIRQYMPALSDGIQISRISLPDANPSSTHPSCPTLPDTPTETPFPFPFIRHGNNFPNTAKASRFVPTVQTNSHRTVNAISSNREPKSSTRDNDTPISSSTAYTKTDSTLSKAGR